MNNINTQMQKTILVIVTLILSAWLFSGFHVIGGTLVLIIGAAIAVGGLDALTALMGAIFRLFK